MKPWILPRNTPRTMPAGSSTAFLTPTKRQSKLSDGQPDVLSAPAPEGGRCTGIREQGFGSDIGWFDLGLGADGAFENFDGGAAYARSELFSGLRNFHLNFAGAAHLDSLRDVQRVAGAELSMFHQVRSERPGGGTGGGVFIHPPGHHAARMRRGVAGERKTIRQRALLPECLAAAQRHHQVKDSGVDELRVQFGIEIFQRKT